ncbi:MAG TPA: glycosyltransferase family 2 protein [Sphingomicrobium sp.]
MTAWKPREDWLREAVASVLAERECDIELVLIDDGNDLPIRDMLADVSDPSLRVIRIAHGGHYAARNAGLKAARGDYARFFDADDVAVEGSTGRLLAAAQAHGPGTAAYGWTQMCDDQLAPYRLLSGDCQGDVVEDFLLNRFDVYIHGILFPRAALDRVGAWNETYRLMGDRDFVLRAFEQAPVCRLAEAVTLYRRHPASITRSASAADAVRAGLQVLEDYFARHPEHRGSNLERTAYKNLHLLRCRQFLRLRDFPAAIRQLALAARRDPAAVTALVLRSLARRVTRSRRRTP